MTRVRCCFYSHNDALQVAQSSLNSFIFVSCLFKTTKILVQNLIKMNSLLNLRSNLLKVPSQIKRNDKIRLKEDIYFLW